MAIPVIPIVGGAIITAIGSYAAYMAAKYMSRSNKYERELGYVPTTGMDALIKMFNTMPYILVVVGIIYIINIIRR